MTRLPFVFDDGGRAAAGFDGPAKGDCAARAVAIATELSYQEAHDAIARLSKDRAIVRKSDPERGVYRVVLRWLLEEELGWIWRDPFDIAGTVVVRLAAGEIPSSGRLIVAMRGHFAAVIDGKLRDTWDCSRRGEQRIAGYWRPVRPGS